MADDLQGSINSRLWSEEKGAYVDCRVGDELSQKVSEQSNLLWVYTGAVDNEDKWKRIHHYLYESGHSVVRTTTPYMNFYMASALYEMGYHDQALKLIRDYWGEMVKRGATSFWEKFDPASPPGSTPSADISYCHGWSSGPGRLLPDMLLVGEMDVTDVDRIEPRLGRIMWAKAVIPTSWGDLRVLCRSRNGLYRVEINVPRMQTWYKFPVIVPTPTGTSVYLDAKRVRLVRPPYGRLGRAQVKLSPGHHVIEVRK